MRRILDCHKNLVVVLATQLAFVGAAHADDVSTSFEFNDVSGEFSLGNPETVSADSNASSPPPIFISWKISDPIEVAPTDLAQAVLEPPDAATRGSRSQSPR